MTQQKIEDITDSALKEALQDANIPTLLMTVCQLSGDLSLLDGPYKPSRSLDGVRHMPEGFQQEIRDRAFALITNLRDGKQTAKNLPDADTLQHMLSLYVGEPVGAEYVPMFIEDMGFENALEKSARWTAPDPTRQLSDHHVVIAGAGLSGVGAAIHLKKAGIPFTIYEKNDSLGGTWYENTYPACGVDTPNHFYSFSFEPNADWSGYYSKRDEIYAYIRRVAEKYDLLDHIQLGCRLDQARYEENQKCWSFDITGPDGTTETLQSRFFISAVGQLNQPQIPDFKGLEEFEGPAFHSARWQADIKLRDKKVVVVGTGASAMQFCPEIAKEAGQLSILQRTPHWIRILPDYHRNVSDGKKWLLKHLPAYQSWYRFRLFWSYGDGVWDSLHKDPNWPDQAHSLNAQNARHREIYIQNLRDALNGREDLLDKMVPDYPPFAKRMLIDNHWCDMLQRPNVELTTAGVEQISATGVTDSNGDFHAADVIIFGTGFDAINLLGSLDIRGRNGQSIHELWGEDPRAYLGMTAPDFPNFFMFYGPNTNLAHGGSLIFHIECQARYITRCLMHMIEQDYTEMEVQRSAHDAYNRDVDAEHDAMVWTHPGVDSWYRNSKGRVVSVSPWRLVDYWSMTRQADLSAYNFAS